MKKRTAEKARLKAAGSMAGLLIFLLAAPVYALEPISEKEMDRVTGQRGINFVLDDVQIYKHKGSGGMWFQDGSGGQTAAVGIAEMEGMLHVNAVLPGQESGDPPTGIGSTDLKGDYGYSQNQSETYNQTYDYSGHRISDYDPVPGGIGITDMVPALSSGALHNAGWAGSLAGVDNALPGVMIHLPSAEIHAEMRAEIAMTADPAGGDSLSFGEVYTRATLTVLGGGHVEIVPGGKSDIYHMVEESGAL